ncbi:D-glycero-beta-D-manno-heptose 1-phosphate adenylyltransferase [Nocardiopsis halotolerans]|uniref:D-glycero-beta-D-manno-heptose 1-phosphate adenylyltransferase n=1 Tax=Nocardiopsis halotolerans TaxID=124252 RepID=UPI000348F4DC|nr:D-glycero-beta-D-manno-heptose 1-phosphate adenylyltransferase [Nocardiopsis halotolerans]
MSDRTVVVVGDALLDVDLRGVSRRDCPDAPAPVLEGFSSWYRPGGAALAALCASRAGHDVVLVTAVGRDEAADDLAALLGEGVRLVGLPLMEHTPTKTRVQANGRTVARLDQGCDGVEADAPAELVERALADASAVLVADYGHGLVRQRAVRRALAACAERVPLVWDPHPRGADPVPGTRLATPNAAEAGVAGSTDEEVLRRAGELAGAWGVRSVAVTLGARGAAWSDAAGEDGLVPGDPVRSPTDTCGAGDAFAAACATALGDGVDARDAVRHGVVSATHFVAGGGAAAHAAPRPTAPEPRASAVPGPRTAERARGGRPGRVVATGGCFDVLHAGHIDLLRRARALGDRLVVLLNSDASVRRLKGSERPVVGESDRARVLSALDCVDEVVVFGEDTPVRALEDLRPDVWVKGGDYDVEDLPETPVVRRAGGEVVTVPLVPGHSTTGLITRIRGRGRDGVPVR